MPSNTVDGVGGTAKKSESSATKPFPKHSAQDARPSDGLRPIGTWRWGWMDDNDPESYDVEWLVNGTRLQPGDLTTLLISFGIMWLTTDFNDGLNSGTSVNPHGEHLQQQAHHCLANTF